MGIRGIIVGTEGLMQAMKELKLDSSNPHAFVQYLFVLQEATHFPNSKQQAMEKLAQVSPASLTLFEFAQKDARLLLLDGSGLPSWELGRLNAFLSHNGLWRILLPYNSTWDNLSRLCAENGILFFKGS